MKKKKENYENVGGVWRTIGGRKVFIRKGQSLSDAMKESGKFKKIKREDIVKGKMEIRRDELNEEYYDTLKKYGEAKIKNDKRDKARYYARASRNVERTKQLKDDIISYDDPKTYIGDISNLQGKHIAGKEATKNKTFALKTQSYFGSNDLGEWEGKDFEEAKASFLKENPDYENGKYGHITGSEIKNKKEDEEYKLFKRAKEDPDSIDPMTENSTDWEALDKKYGSRYKTERDNYETRVYGSDVTEADKQMKKVFGENFRYAEEYKTGFEEKKKESYEEYVQRVLNNDDYLQANRPNAYFNKMVKETPYIKTLEKHNLNNSDPEFKRSMLGRMESDIKYYTGNGGGYSGHLWAKDEKEQIDLMKALYNTLPEKEKPDWINESKIDEYSKQMDFIKNNKNIKERYSTMYDYLKNNTLMSESEIIKQLKELDKKRK